MSVAPFAGVVALDNFKEPTGASDGLQGQVPKPLAGQQDYVLTASGFVPGGNIPGLGTMASQNANNVAITGGAIDGVPIGLTDPNKGRFTTLEAGVNLANYVAISGGATTQAVKFETLGTDTNISIAFQTKGTGAIDLAAGSRGINISNGGTVTAIAGVTAGAYTSIPTVTVSPPTTAGGVQATATASMQAQSGPVINVAGTNYAVNDTLTLVGGTFTQAAVYTIATISGSGVATTTLTTAGGYLVLPTAPIATTSSGAGTGCTLTPAWGVRTGGFTITNAGSGYVEQPTVTFSSGSAAAYATVGGIPTIKTIGSALSFATPSGEMFRLLDAAVTTSNYLSLEQGGGGIIARTAGTGTNLPISFSTKGTGGYIFGTNSAVTTQQFGISHTASAVNYVQVTGAATGNQPSITAQGSDATVILNIASKGAANILFNANGAEQFRSGAVASAVNAIQLNGAATGNSPSVQARGTNTDVDLTLLPKGTGNVRFGTYTGTILTPTGYIEIKDSGGTLRRLLVG